VLLYHIQASCICNYTGDRTDDRSDKNVVLTSRKVYSRASNVTMSVVDGVSGREWMTPFLYNVNTNYSVTISYTWQLPPAYR